MERTGMIWVGSIQNITHTERRPHCCTQISPREFERALRSFRNNVGPGCPSGFREFRKGRAMISEWKKGGM